jgi:hypothetical protein
MRSVIVCDGTALSLSNLWLLVPICLEYKAERNDPVPSNSLQSNPVLHPESNGGLLSQIHGYAKCCDSARGGIDEIIMQNRLMSVANFIDRDRIGSENGVLPHDIKGD